MNLHTGGYNWLLGDGGHSSFKLGPGVHFYWQHDAQFQPGGLISLFNNASDPPKERESSGLLLRPDFSSHTVTLVKRFANPSHTLLASSQGDTAEPARRRLAARLRGAAQLHRVRRLRPRAARRHARQERAGLPHLPLAVERPPDHRARDRRGSEPVHPGRGRSQPSRRAGTAPPPSPPGRCSPAPRPKASRPLPPHHARAFRPRST